MRLRLIRRIFFIDHHVILDCAKNIQQKEYLTKGFEPSSQLVPVQYREN